MTKRWRAFLLMMANAALVFALHWIDRPGDEALVTGGLLAGMIVVIALLLVARPRGFVATLGRGVAAAMILVCVGALVFASLLVLFLTEYGPRRLSWTEYGFAAAFLVVNLGLWRVLAPDPPGRPYVAKTAGAGCGVIVAFFVLFYLGEIINSLGPIILAIPRMRADSVMMASIPRVQACALSYMKGKARYPASLAELGPAPTGTGCLDAQYASGKIGRVSLEYHPGTDDQHYQVFARGATGLEGEPRLAFGDESGIVRGGPATDTLENLPIANGGLLSVRSVRACAEYARSRYAGNSYPEDPLAVYSDRFPADMEYQLHWLGCVPRHFPSFDPKTHIGSMATYTPVRDSGRIVDYVLEIRPRVYGVHGIRSLRTTARGPVHFTLEDRAATDADPIVPPCEYEVASGTCAAAPGGVRANVTIVVPDTITIGEPFVVTIRDDRDPGAGTAPYQYRVECGRWNRGETKPDLPYSFESAQECMIQVDGEPGSIVFARVWVRDVAGSETTFERRVVMREK